MSSYLKELPSSACRVPGLMNWVDPEGNFYGIETRLIKETKHKHYGEFFKYKPILNNHNGYLYVPSKVIINEETNEFKTVQRRLNILVATVFVENPNKYIIVGHRNNIKTDNRAANLYWATASENTQKAFNDGLIVNAKGSDDSQSMPVIMFETSTNSEIGRYGSVSEAERLTGISKGTILRQARYKKPVRKPFYFRFIDDETASRPTVVIQMNIADDKEIDRFCNAEEASRYTGVDANTIRSQCHLGKKPKRSKTGYYFKYS